MKYRDVHAAWVLHSPIDFSLAYLIALPMDTVQPRPVSATIYASKDESFAGIASIRLLSIMPRPHLGSERIRFVIDTELARRRGHMVSKGLLHLRISQMARTAYCYWHFLHLYAETAAVRAVYLQLWSYWYNLSKEASFG